MKKVLLFVFVVLVVGGISWYVTEEKTCQQMNWDNSFCIDELLKLPETIGDYTGKFSQKNWDQECKNLKETQVCTKEIRAEYNNNEEKKSIHVIPQIFENKEQIVFFEQFLVENNYTGETIAPGIKIFKSQTLSGRNRNNKIFWKTNSEKVDFIGIQFYTYTTRDDGAIIPQGSNVDTENQVVRYFLEKYPPVK